MAADVAQQERSNNKCYTSSFRYIYRLGMVNMAVCQERVLHML